MLVEIPPDADYALARLPDISPGGLFTFMGRVLVKTNVPVQADDNPDEEAWLCLDPTTGALVPVGKPAWARADFVSYPNARIVAGQPANDPTPDRP